MKEHNYAVLPAPGLLNVDLKGMQTPAERLIYALKTLLFILAPVFKVVAYFVALVLIFVVMFGFFVMAATIQEPKAPEKIIIIEKGEYNGTYNATNPVPSRI